MTQTQHMPRLSGRCQGADLFMVMMSFPSTICRTGNAFQWQNKMAEPLNYLTGCTRDA